MADRWVIEGGRRTGLPPESFDGRLVAREPLGQELQRDFAAERKVFGEIDDTHAAPTEQRIDPIVTDDIAGRHAGALNGNRTKPSGALLRRARSEPRQWAIKW